MINEEQQQKIEALREELRNGRRANQTGESAIGHGESTDGQTGPSVSSARRNNPAVDGNTGPARGNKRGPKKEPKRIGQGSGRPGNDGSSTTDRSEQGTRDTGHVAAIERLDDIPERIDPILPTKGRYKEDYKRKWKGNKHVYTLLTDPSIFIEQGEYDLLPNTPTPQKPSIFSHLTGLRQPSDTSNLRTSSKTTLTQQEAKDFLDPLASALIDYGGYVDKFLQFRTHDANMPDIWGDLTEAESLVLARLMIRRGQKSAAAASVVRNMVHGDDYIQAAIIVIPRVMRTVEATRRIPKRGRS